MSSSSTQPAAAAPQATSTDGWNSYNAKVLAICILGWAFDIYEATIMQLVTPLLIIHSEDDLRCPIEQGEQLVVALKQLRREVRFVRFPGENHEMSRSGKPRHRLDRFRHILEWFAAYLEKTPA